MGLDRVINCFDDTRELTSYIRNERPGSQDIPLSFDTVRIFRRKILSVAFNYSTQLRLELPVQVPDDRHQSH